jgi:transketolase
MSEFKDLIGHAQSVRINALNSVYKGKASHIGSGFSCVELLVYLYARWLNVSARAINDPRRDRFVLSKGHAAAVYYSVLVEFGFLPKEWLDRYCEFGCPLGGHVQYGVPGVEVSTGSLGHGLPIAVGMALAARRSKKKYRVVVLLSDGEMESGSNWEALNMASAQKLDNLIVIIDRNGLQAMGFTEDILPMNNLDQRINSFGCICETIDGHNFREIDMSFKRAPFVTGKPSVIIAKTVKGKGVSFMENKLEWHYRSPNSEQFEAAMKELK